MASTDAGGLAEGMGLCAAAALPEETTDCAWAIVVSVASASAATTPQHVVRIMGNDLMVESGLTKDAGSTWRQV